MIEDIPLRGTKLMVGSKLSYSDQLFEPVTSATPVRCSTNWAVGGHGFESRWSPDHFHLQPQYNMNFIYISQINSDKEKSKFLCANLHLMVYSRFFFSFSEMLFPALAIKATKRIDIIDIFKVIFGQKVHHHIPFLPSFYIRYSLRTTLSLGLEA